MNFQNDKDRDRRRSSDHSFKSAATDRHKSKKKPAGEVGTALRTVYQRTVDEDIPPEMLDLLGKLG